MKGRLISFIVLLLAGATLFSCSKDAPNSDEFLLSYGVIVGTNPDYKIKLDNGTTLKIEVNKIPNFDVENGQRVLADYSPIDKLPEGAQTFAPITEVRVVLNFLYDILTKDYLVASENDTKEKKDIIGYDYITVKEAWIGSKYLNVQFEFYMNNPSIKHLVNLVYDDVRSTETDIYFIMKHNAKGDANYFRAFGRVSFDIESILKKVELGKNTKIHLLWDGYDFGNQSKTIAFNK